MTASGHWFFKHHYSPFDIVSDRLNSTSLVDQEHRLIVLNQGTSNNPCDTVLKFLKSFNLSPKQYSNRESTVQLMTYKYQLS